MGFFYAANISAECLIIPEYLKEKKQETEKKAVTEASPWHVGFGFDTLTSSAQEKMRQKPLGQLYCALRGP